jgi:hypothetical protein
VNDVLGDKLVRTQTPLILAWLLVYGIVGLVRWICPSPKGWRGDSSAPGKMNAAGSKYMSGGVFEPGTENGAMKILGSRRRASFEVSEAERVTDLPKHLQHLTSVLACVELLVDGRTRRNANRGIVIPFSTALPSLSATGESVSAGVYHWALTSALRTRGTGAPVRRRVFFATGIATGRRSISANEMGWEESGGSQSSTKIGRMTHGGTSHLSKSGLANRRLQPLGHISMKADMPEAAASRKRQIARTSHKAILNRIAERAPPGHAPK